jgi:hypothetical protein
MPQLSGLRITLGYLDQQRHHVSPAYGYPWSWLVSQQELVNSALSGMALSFAMAFAVLNIATGNLLMATLSTITVAGIVSTALGIGVVGIMKWPLGISESISVVILIGFSMDYVLHLAGATRQPCMLHNQRYWKFFGTAMHGALPALQGGSRFGTHESAAALVCLRAAPKTTPVWKL